MATIDRTTISGNTEGGVYDEGVSEWENTSLTITNSTIAGNGEGADQDELVQGELVLGYGDGRPGPVTVTDSTLDAPTGSDGAEVHAVYVDTVGDDDPPDPDLTMGGDILNAVQDACSFVSFTDAGDNLANDTSCDFGEDSRAVDDVMLGPLADNGGPTKTMLPAAGSPAIDVISDTNENCLANDQRGVDRPSPSGGRCDVGAVEVTPEDEDQGGGSPPAKAPSTTTLAASPASGAAVEGQAITLTATVSGNAGNPTGTISFEADGSSINAGCDSAAVSTSSGVTTATCTVSGGLTAGTHAFVATYGGNDSYTGSSGSIATYAVTSSGGGSGGGGGSSTAVPPTVRLTADPVTGAVAGDPVTLTVEVSGPSITPTGTVTFIIDGVETSCGTVPLTGSNGVATATCQVPAGLADGTHTLSVNYSGDVRYLAGTATIASYVVVDSGTSVTPPSSGGIVPPTILAKVHSKHRRHHGWYRNPITITFKCWPGSSPLAEPCPVPFHLRRNVINQSVAVSVSGTDGGTATARVSHINIDRTKPRLRIVGARNHHHYRYARVARIRAHDKLSGLAWSHLKLRHTYRLNRHGQRVQVVHVRAIARDRAGNKRVRHLKYYLR